MGLLCDVNVQLIMHEAFLCLIGLSWILVLTATE